MTQDEFLVSSSEDSYDEKILEKMSLEVNKSVETFRRKRSPAKVIDLTVDSIEDFDNLFTRAHSQGANK